MNVKLCTDEKIIIGFVTSENGSGRRISSVDIPFECDELSDKYPEAQGVFFLNISSEENYYIYYYAWENSVKPIYIDGSALGMDEKTLFNNIVKGLDDKIEFAF